ncbi:hypothetical protein [uncultured Algibacter sp.]|uniref:hypothetical protein n=1 Tax=uncultured Algibacter sp. TaxID=298659 RepID=UPI00262067C1|nr:hypothetical protein [uncultured Algibacter sp.]
MKKLLQIVLIGLLTLSCNSKKKTEPKTFEEAELELANYSEEDRMKELEYLKANVFKGLENLNDGFDSESIYYFSESDFEIVLDRVEKNGLGIYGIEPWIDGDFYGVLIVEDFDTIATDPKWYRKAFTEFKASGKELLYAASYEVPKKLLK